MEGWMKGWAVHVCRPRNASSASKLSLLREILVQLPHAGDAAAEFLPSTAVRSSLGGGQMFCLDWCERWFALLSLWPSDGGVG